MLQIAKKSQKPPCFDVAWQQITALSCAKSDGKKGYIVDFSI